MSMCPEGGDVCESLCGSQSCPGLAIRAASSIISFPPTPASSKKLRWRWGWGCHCHCPPHKFKDLCFPGRECLQNMHVARRSLG